MRASAVMRREEGNMWTSRERCLLMYTEGLLKLALVAPCVN